MSEWNSKTKAVGRDLADGYVKLKAKNDDLKRWSGVKDNLIKEQEAQIKQLEAEKKILLTEYSEWLGKYGYLDSDWWCEPPNAVDRFMSGEE